MVKYLVTVHHTTFAWEICHQDEQHDQPSTYGDRECCPQYPLYWLKPLCQGYASSSVCLGYFSNIADDNPKAFRCGSTLPMFNIKYAHVVDCQHLWDQTQPFRAWKAPVSFFIHAVISLSIEKRLLVMLPRYVNLPTTFSLWSSKYIALYIMQSGYRLVHYYCFVKSGGEGKCLAGGWKSTQVLHHLCSVWLKITVIDIQEVLYQRLERFCHKMPNGPNAQYCMYITFLTLT